MPPNEPGVGSGRLGFFLNHLCQHISCLIKTRGVILFLSIFATILATVLPAVFRDVFWGFVLSSRIRTAAGKMAS